MKTKHLISIICVLCASILFLYAYNIREAPDTDNGIVSFVKNLIGNTKILPSLDKNKDNPTDETKIDPTIPIDSLSEEELSELIFSYVEETAELINEERTNNNLPELTLDEDVLFSAMARSEEIVTTMNHTRPDGGEYFNVLTDNNISYTTCSESLAVGVPTPSEAVNGWMLTTEDRTNILNTSYQKFGIGLYIAEDSYKYYWVMLFVEP